MLDLSVLGHTTWEYRSTEKLSYKYTKAIEKTDKKNEKTYTAVKNAKEQEISIRWNDSEAGQHLTFWHDESLVAKFTLTNNKKIIWEPTDAYMMDQDITAKPSNPNNVAIVAGKLLQMFKIWINSVPFAQYLDQLSRELVYPPKLVKMLILFTAYLNIRTKTAEKVGKLADDIDLVVDMSQVAKVFKILLNQVVGDTPHMMRLYADSDQYLLPVSEKVETTTDPKEGSQELEQVEPTPNTSVIDVQTTEPEKVAEPKTDPNTEMLKRIETKAAVKSAETDKPF